MLLLVLLRLLLVDCCSKKLSSFYWYRHCAVANTTTLADAVAITSHLVYFLLFQQFATVGAVTASFAEPTPPRVAGVAALPLIRSLPPMPSLHWGLIVVVPVA